MGPEGWERGHNLIADKEKKGDFLTIHNNYNKKRRKKNRKKKTIKTSPQLSCYKIQDIHLRNKELRRHGTVGCIGTTGLWCSKHHS
jgi:hypothetical protein